MAIRAQPAMGRLSLSLSRGDKTILLLRCHERVAALAALSSLASRGVAAGNAVSLRAPAGTATAAATATADVPVEHAVEANDIAVVAAVGAVRDERDSVGRRRTLSQLPV